jgi:AcrR family transcriptional regulator
VRYKKSEISAAQIVAAATRVIARQGYAQTSLMDIATEAGMSKGAVHYHYPSKEALIGKVLEYACDQVAERARAAWSSSPNPLDAVREGILVLWRLRAQRTDAATVVTDLLAQSLHDEALRPALANYYRFAATQLLEHLVVHMQTMGLRPKVRAEMLPRILTGLLDGLVMQYFVDPDAVTEDDVVQAVGMLAMGLFEPGK